jgi:hypothetical protein
LGAADATDTLCSLLADSHHYYPRAHLLSDGTTFLASPHLDLTKSPVLPGTQSLWSVTQHLPSGVTSINRSAAGAPFEPVHTFAGDITFPRLILAPGNPKLVYLAGYSSVAEATTLVASADAGKTW